jgi:hypothetical protein
MNVGMSGICHLTKNWSFGVMTLVKISLGDSKSGGLSDIVLSGFFWGNAMEGGVKVSLEAAAFSSLPKSEAAVIASPAPKNPLLVKLLISCSSVSIS